MPRSIPGFQDRHRHLITNAAWLLADRGIRMVGGLFVGIWVARYLGPDPFGLLNYALAFIGLFSAFATLGLDRLVIKEVVLHPEARDEVLGTAFALKLAGGLLAQAAAVAAAHLVRQDSRVTLMVAIVAGTALLQAFDVVDFWFQAKVRSRLTVIARNGAFVVFLGVKVALILTEAGVTAFAIAMLAEAALAAAGLVFLYRRGGDNPFAWRFARERAAALLGEGWPLLVAYMAYLIYAKIDQIMLGSILGDKALGLYSAALKIAEIPVAVLLIVGSTLFPKLVELYEADRPRFFRWYSDITGVMTWSAMAFLGGAWLAGPYLVDVLFGPEFGESGRVLIYQAAGLVFVFNGGLRSAFLTITGHQRILSVTTVLAAVLNVGLNALLIPRYGIYGSAGAGVAVQAVSLFLLNALTRPTWPLFRIQLQALLLFPLILRIPVRRK